MPERHDAGAPPPIPVWLEHLPVQGNLVVPWIAARGRDGRYHFGIDDAGRRLEAVTGRLCGVCGRPHDRRTVLVMRLSDLTQQHTTQPGLHPQCLAYTRQACPMISGNVNQYRSTPRQLGPGLELGSNGLALQGAIAEPWFAVWVEEYNVLTDETADRVFASYEGMSPLRVRLISWWLSDATLRSS